MKRKPSNSGWKHSTCSTTPSFYGVASVDGEVNHPHFGEITSAVAVAKITIRPTLREPIPQLSVYTRMCPVSEALSRLRDPLCKRHRDRGEGPLCTLRRGQQERVMNTCVADKTLPLPGDGAGLDVGCQPRQTKRSLDKATGRSAQASRERQVGRALRG